MLKYDSDETNQEPEPGSHATEVFKLLYQIFRRILINILWAGIGNSICGNVSNAGKETETLKKRPGVA